MSPHTHDQATMAFMQAESRLFASSGLQVASRRVRLADPPVSVRVLEAGDGPPLVLVHGSGMSASTWAPLMPYLATNRLIALDLPGSGLSDPFDYTGRPLRSHAVAQLTSLLDALGLDQVPVVGTSLGGMWALCLALDAPERVAAVASLGVPAVALPGMHGDPAFTALSTPGLRHLMARLGSPSVAITRRAMARGVIGPRGAERAPEGFFEVVHEGIRQPGVRTAMLTHMYLAMRFGRPRAENILNGIRTAAAHGSGTDDLGRRGPLRRTGDRPARLRAPTQCAARGHPRSSCPFPRRPGTLRRLDRRVRSPRHCAPPRVGPSSP
jgi:pimeloyl-ACP methyl ester carboxylesterase